ncbi:DoxX family protein [Tessaracoccus caeni]|uniref:DoxX family protein n=1 Tax=Tessaracoccus caeni TaxID=3031239 RepID=UPI0023D9DDA0|nr:DoxX family protein [Tessaracoccus caeni]MDF1490145.1 DoxX family protein [Tessaracoccus caeni]
MSLTRFVARSLFASYYVVDGASSVINPESRAADAASVTERAVPLLQRVVPPSYSSHIPDSPESWVRVVGAAKLVGGVMFATGLGRRLGAALLTGSAAFDLASGLPKDTKDIKMALPELLRDGALLGASVIAMQDLEGKPSLAWRTKHAAQAADRKVDQITSDVSRKARKANRQVQRKAQSLSRSAKRQAKKVTKQVESALS